MESAKLSPEKKIVVFSNGAGIVAFTGADSG